MQPQSSIDLSVVIVNYNVRRFLENALDSIRRASSGLSVETFVVDNASDDGSCAMVRERFPDVCLIENQANMGFARANNLALKRAQGRHLLLLNPDTIVQEDTFRIMIDFLRDHPDAGLAGCKVLNPDGSFQLPCRRGFPTPWVAFTKIFGLSALFPRSRLFGRYNLTYLDPEETHSVDAVSGAFMFLKREVYDVVGGLDESFFMYGEDLDWCYRIQKAGYKVYYVHSTRIVHFKGESTRRGNIDEIKVFYQAMELFVEKHFSNSLVVEFLLSLGIALRASVAFFTRSSRWLVAALIDIAAVGAAMVLAEFLYLGALMRFPAYAYPAVQLVPGVVTVLCLYGFGVYTEHRGSVSRSILAVLSAFVIIAATVFFAKDFAFSRGVALIAGSISLVLVPGWRFVLWVKGYAHGHRVRPTLFGRPTVIVGTGPAAQAVLQKLRVRVGAGYDIIGFVDTTTRSLGDRIGGTEVLGSIAMLGRIIRERRVTEVILTGESLSNSDILTLIEGAHAPGVNFRLVPDSLGAIVGKTRIDEIDPLPMVDVAYNIQRPLHRSAKRILDGVLGLAMLPFGALLAIGGRTTAVRTALGLLQGTITLVGRPADWPDGPLARMVKPGFTGLVQINSRSGLTAEEADQYLEYYARNHTFVLDVEILMKAVSLAVQRAED